MKLLKKYLFSTFMQQTPPRKTLKYLLLLIKLNPLTLFIVKSNESITEI
jgi:hypothetical protein